SQLDSVASTVNDVASSVKNINRLSQITGNGAASAGTQDSVAIGSDAQAVDSSVAVGARSRANVVGTTALGVDSHATGISSTAVGRQTNTLGDRSVAVGFNSFVRQSGEYGVALGTDAGVSGKDSISLGHGSRTYEAEVLSLGSGNGLGGPATRRIVNLSPGNVSLGSTEAVNGGQFFQAISSVASILGGGAAVGAQGMLIAPAYQIQGSSYSTVGAALKALDGKVTDLDNRVAGRGDVNHSVAGSASAGTASVSTAALTSSAVVARNNKVASGATVSDSSAGTNALTLSKGNGVTPAASENNTQSSDEVQLSSMGSVGNARQIVTMAAATLPTDGVNKAQLDSGISAANSYTDARISALNDSFQSLRGDLNWQMRRQDRRINRQGAMSAAMLNMATSAAGIRTPNRLGAGVGFQNGQSALSIGYQHAFSDNSNFTIGGAFSSSDTSVGVGAGFGW
ncbi:hypothetical protein FUT69_05845, partial [Xylella taiwanensis]|uniref:YadA-like family protein n=1 Tax=Xylella taiwanensis TaxID=1444770 RepID=UPI0013BF7A32